MRAQLFVLITGALYVTLHTYVRKKYYGKYDLVDRVMLHTSVLAIVIFMSILIQIW